jgi:hypothetical protein
MPGTKAVPAVLKTAAGGHFNAPTSSLAPDTIISTTANAAVTVMYAGYAGGDSWIVLSDTLGLVGSRVRAKDVVIVDNVASYNMFSVDEYLSVRPPASGCTINLPDPSYAANKLQIEGLPIVITNPWNYGAPGDVIISAQGGARNINNVAGTRTLATGHTMTLAWAGDYTGGWDIIAST